MRQPSIVLNTHERDYSGLVNLGNTVYDSISGNIYFSSPNPDLMTLRASIDEVTTAIGIWGPVGNRGSHLDLVDLREKSKNLFMVLHSEALYVQGRSRMAAAGDYMRMETMMSSSGFPLRKKNERQGVLEKVQNLHFFFSRQLSRNQVKLEWEKPLNLNSRNNVKNYNVFRAATPAFSEAVSVMVTGSMSFTDTNNTGVIQTWHYWVRPFNAAGYGVVSEMITVQVLPA